jgi:hypothetical protein
MIRLEHLCATTVLATSPARAWRVIGDFYGLGRWYPGVVKLEQIHSGERQIRVIHSGDGTHFKEELIFRHSSSKSISYQLDAGDLDVTVYVSIITVARHTSGTCKILWDTIFQSLPRKRESNHSDIAEIMADGLRSLELLFGVPSDD